MSLKSPISRPAVLLALALLIGAAGPVGCDKKADDAKASSGAADKKAPAKATAAKVQKVQQVADLEILDLAALKKRVKGSKAKATLVAVWATWCAPCIEEMPTLAKFYNTHKDKGLEVIGLSVDDRSDAETAKKLQTVLEKIRVPFEIALLKPETDEAFFKGLGVEWDSGLPATVVFDASGERKLYTRKQLTDAFLKDKVLPLLR